MVMGANCWWPRQHYPPAFGAAVVETFIQHRQLACQHECAKPGDTIDQTRKMLKMKDGDDDWHDAMIKPVELFLAGRK